MRGYCFGCGRGGVAKTKRIADNVGELEELAKESLTALGLARELRTQCQGSSAPTIPVSAFRKFAS